MDIKVVKILTGFRDRPYINNLTQEEIDKMYKEIYPLKYYSWNDKRNSDNIEDFINLGFQEGYFIQNVDDKPLDLSKVETENNIKELKKYEITCLQLKSLIFLLFLNKQPLRINNGTFYINNKDLFNRKDLTSDDYLSNFYFKFNSNYFHKNYFSGHYHYQITSKNYIEIYKYYNSDIQAFYPLQVDDNIFANAINQYWPKWGRTNLNNQLNAIKFVKYLIAKKSKIRKFDQFYKVRLINSGQKAVLIDLLKADDFSWFYKNSTIEDTILEKKLNNGDLIYNSKSARYKERKTDQLIYFNNTPIKNPKEFNIPNAQGSINLSLSKKYDFTLLKNMNFGNLTINTLKINRIDNDIFNNLSKDGQLTCKLLKECYFLNDINTNAIINCQEMADCTGFVPQLNLSHKLFFNPSYFTGCEGFSLTINKLNTSNPLFINNKSGTIANITINNLYFKDITKKAYMKFEYWVNRALKPSKNKINLHIKNLLCEKINNDKTLTIYLGRSTYSTVHKTTCMNLIIDKLDPKIKILELKWVIDKSFLPNPPCCIIKGKAYDLIIKNANSITEPPTTLVYNKDDYDLLTFKIKV